MKRAQDKFVCELAAKYGEDLVRYLSRRVATAADARDLAQEAYVRLLRLERKELIENPQAYLYRVAANLVYEMQLKKRSDAAGLKRWTDERAHNADSIGVDRAADAIGVRRRVQEVFDALSPKCRAVLIFHRQDGMTYDEIGAKLGISSSMVKKYLAIGLRHCREQLRGLE